MNVSGVGYFVGDEDPEAAALQETMYDLAVGAIVGTCNRLTRNAKRLLEDDRRPDWGEVYRYDQRFFRRPHDLMAAAWRHRHDVLQLELPLPENGHSYAPDGPQSFWFSWLNDELRSWSDEPRLVRYVQRILVNRYSPDAYVAESELCIALADHFCDVPWRDDLLDSLQRRLDQDQRNARGWRAKPRPRGRQSLIPDCECQSERRPPCGIIPCRTTSLRAAREGWGPLE